MTIRMILVVDDDARSREILVEASTSRGYQTSSAVSAADGMHQVSSLSPDLVIADLGLAGSNGLSFFQELSTRLPDLPVIAVAPEGRVEAGVAALREGARDFLMRPLAPAAVRATVERVHATLDLESETGRLRTLVRTTPDLVAECTATREALESARRFATSGGTVLITGENGTGKERFAEQIHYKSPRALGPFVRLSCSGASDAALERELFGRRESVGRPSRFQAACGGTLLLDEVGALSPALQTRLATFLKDDGVVPSIYGGGTPSQSVRLVATSSANLTEEVGRGRFREDLFERLNVLPLHLLPLRSRKEDVLPMARHFLRFFSERHGLSVPTLTEEATARLMGWSWPDNVRELESTIQRAVLISRGDLVEARDLLLGIDFGDRHASRRAQGLACGPGAPVNLVNRKLADIEREAILATLEATGGNKTEAARRLGVSARTLSNKMKVWRQAGLVA